MCPARYAPLATALLLAGCSGAPADRAANGGDAAAGSGGEPAETAAGGHAGTSGQLGGEGDGGFAGAAAGAAGGGGAGGGAGGASYALPCTALGSEGECGDIETCTDGGVSVPGYCPGPWNVKCCVHDPAECEADAHVLPNGGLAEVPGLQGCPTGMLRVETFCIDRFEASLVGLDGKPWSPFFNPGMTPVMAVSLEGAVPQAYVSGIEAAAACDNAGKRLCTDAEWLRACQGPTGATYPWGDVLEPGACNDARSEHPAIEYFGTSDDWIWSELGHACLDQLADSLDRTGENPACVTSEGAYDMMGNLHEWTADPDGTFRGGFFVDTVNNGPGCLYATTAHTTSHWDYSTGFRCCADAPL